MSPARITNRVHTEYRAERDEGKAITYDRELYRLRLGDGAAQRGARVLCELLGWVGDAESLAQVRILHSTVLAYPVGRVGVVRRERLIPARTRPAV